MGVNAGVPVAQETTGTLDAMSNDLNEKGFLITEVVYGILQLQKKIRRTGSVLR